MASNASVGSNPTQIAQSMANAQYNPAITSLQNLLASLNGQNQYNQKQIGGWYTQMQNLMNSQNANQGQATQNQIADFSGQLGNVAQLFGASNAQQMQPALANGAGMLSAVGASNQDYLSNMIPLLAAQAAQSTQNEQNTARAQQNNYQQQLTEQQNAKGNAYTADYQQALSNKSTEQQNAFALGQEKALLPYQISSARSTAQADAANAAAAPAYNQAKINAENAQVVHYQALSQQEKAAAIKAIAQAKSSGTPLSPGTASYGRIQKLLVDSLYRPGGRQVLPDPTAATKAILEEARAQGLINSKAEPQVKGALRVINSLLSKMYARDKGWQAGWTWTGSRFVPKTKP